MVRGEEEEREGRKGRNEGKGRLAIPILVCFWSRCILHVHVLQSTINSHMNSGTDNDIGHTVFTLNRKPSITRRMHHNGKAKLKP